MAARRTATGALLPALEVCIRQTAARHRALALHWVLDVVMNEDRNRARRDHGPENLATLQRLVLNILRARPDDKSMRRKIKRAGWDDAFLIRSHMRQPWGGRRKWRACSMRRCRLTTKNGVQRGLRGEIAYF
jgi:hypothetical protein